MLRIGIHAQRSGKDIYRPAWNAFGMDKEGADFRALQNYGPLYKIMKLTFLKSAMM